MAIEKLLKNKTAHERATIKGQKIAKSISPGVYNHNDLTIEIVDIYLIDGGIEIFARAWRDGCQLGFGKDGSVDIERFRIYNPPIYIADELGEKIKEFRDINGFSRIRKYKEDGKFAVLQVLSQNILEFGKIDTDIVPNKIGHTVGTFYPDADPESTSVDGGVQRNVASADWTTNRSSADGTAATPSATFDDASAYARYNTFFIGRAVFLFDTSALGSGSTINSANLVLKVGGNSQPASNNSKTCIIGCSPASNTNLVVADYSCYSALNSPTEFATRQAPASAGSTMTFALNASGISAISLTGISKFMTRCQADVDNASPGDNITYGAGFYYADQTGTTDDPYLSVDYTAVATNTSDFFQLF